jgi:putative acetyltransferase
MNFHLITANTPQDFDTARALILEYVAWLNVDLSFQQFDTEIQHLEEMYSAPGGALVLVYSGPNPMGVAGIRPFEGDICEIKRMYLRPEARGQGLGKALLRRAFEEAQALGYQRMRLDTYAYMETAIALYLSEGFQEIPPYRFNPLENARYFERQL